jgi:hypothetical protein
LRSHQFTQRNAKAPLLLSNQFCNHSLGVTPDRGYEPVARQDTGAHKELFELLLGKITADG